MGWGLSIGTDYNLPEKTETTAIPSTCGLQYPDKSRNTMIPAIFLVLFSTAVWAAEEVIIEHVSSEVVDGACYVDARINFNLDDDLLEALDHGMELDVRIIVRVREKRKWLWDRVYKETKIKFKLDHLPLSDVYIITDVRKSEQRQFDTLENALKYMGKVDRHLLLNTGEITGGPKLGGLIKGVINVKDLPQPMKPVAFLINKWRSDSGWHKWIIRQ